MSLVAELGVDLNGFSLDLALAPPDGSVVALLGPNGAGKTTALRALGGLVPLDRGRLVVDGVVLDDPAAGTYVPPEQRRAATVFQDYLLFPHLDAQANVAFGPRARGVGRTEAERVALQWLEQVGLAERAHRRPAELSGGEAQRVALARALASGPRVLLLDEPLAALDAGTRIDVRRDLGRYLAQFDGSTVLVTHDPVDALALADEVVVLDGGQVIQTGSIDELSSRPRSSYVARLIGTNLVRGRGDGHQLTLDDGLALTLADSVDGPSFAVIPPAAVSLHRARPEGSARNRWPMVVEGLDRLGDRVRVRLTGPVPLVAEVTPAAVADLALVDGATVWAAVKATEITAYPV